MNSSVTSSQPKAHEKCCEKVYSVQVLARLSLSWLKGCTEMVGMKPGGWNITVTLRHESKGGPGFSLGDELWKGFGKKIAQVVQRAGRQTLNEGNGVTCHFHHTGISDLLLSLKFFLQKFKELPIKLTKAWCLSQFSLLWSLGTFCKIYAPWVPGPVSRAVTDTLPPFWTCLLQLADLSHCSWGMQVSKMGWDSALFHSLGKSYAMDMMFIIFRTQN